MRFGKIVKSLEAGISLLPTSINTDVKNLNLHSLYFQSSETLDSLPGDFPCRA